MITPLPPYISESFFVPLLLAAAVLLSLLITPAVITLARRLGAVDPGGYRKKHRNPTPLLGGIAVLLPFLTLCIFLVLLPALTLRCWGWAARVGTQTLNCLMNYAQDRTTIIPDLLVISLGAAATAILGLLDDIRGLKARVKLLGQVVIALGICATGRYLSMFYIPFCFGGVELTPIWGVIVSVVWIVGMMNAFNLIDGIDGLAAGVGLITSVTLGILGGINGDPMVVMVCTVLAGTLLGFLVFNFNPARIFLGDTGSMLIGFLLATITLLSTHKSETAFILVAPILALSLPLFEAGISILRRFIRGVPIFAADSYHTHHRLIYRGLSERAAVFVLYLVTALLSASAILNNLIPEKTRWAWIPPVLYFGTLLWLTWWAGYLRPQTVNRIFSRRQRNSVLTTLARYAAQSLSSAQPEVGLDEVFELCRREIKLDCLEAWFEESGTVICSCRSPGFARDGEAVIKISPPQGKKVVVRYSFRDGLSEEERIDAVACLAGIFEQTDTEVLSSRQAANAK